MSGQDATIAPNQTPSVELSAMTSPKKLPWDARADAYTMSANQIGKTLPQIATDLCKKGYAASTVEVYESLSKQDVDFSMEWATLGTTTTVVPPPTTLLLDWDSRADEITLAAHKLGHSPLQLLAELRWAGYQASIENVGASMYKQGIHRL